MRTLRDAWVVAAFDFGESIRSRRVLVVLVLYLSFSLAGSSVFIALLTQIENALAESLGVASTSTPGTMTHELMHSPQFIEMLGGLVGSDTIARELLTLPPMALFYGWLSLTFIPFLVAMTSSEAVASEVESGSVRFALFRTSRLSWVLGKLGGQATLMMLGLGVGALGVFGVGWTSFAGFEAGPTAWWLCRVTGRAFLYGYAYLGVFLGVSQTVRAPYTARALSFLALGGLGAVGAALKWTAAHTWLVPWQQHWVPLLSESLALVLPSAHRVDLWRPGVSDRSVAEIMLVVLGSLYFGLGHLRFAARDA